MNDELMNDQEIDTELIELELADFDDSVDEVIDSWAVFRSIKAQKPYTKEEEHDVFVRYKQNPTEEIRNEILQHYVRLAVHFAKRYTNSDANLMDDLVQEALIGLCIAIDQFDVDLGYRFSTYASWRILQRVLLYLKKDSIIRFPVGVEESYFRMMRINRQRFQMGQDPATDEELKNQYEFTDSQIRAARNREAINVGSLNATAKSNLLSSDSEATEIEAFIADPKAEQAFLAIENDELRRLLDKMLTEYLERHVRESKRDRFEVVLRRRYGLNGDGTIDTLKDIGQDVGVTRERARQISDGFLKYLQMPQNKRILKDYR